MSGRYDTTANPEDEYYPCTSVLINLEAAGKIPNAVAVFVANPIEEDVREKELTCNPLFADRPLR